MSNDWSEKEANDVIDATNLADLYGLAPIDWSFIAERLANGCPSARDGRPKSPHLLAGDDQRGRNPHLTGVGALWFDGTFWFETGTQTRKGETSRVTRVAR